jgi:hypothetical protein
VRQSIYIILLVVTTIEYSYHSSCHRTQNKRKNRSPRVFCVVLCSTPLLFLRTHSPVMNSFSFVASMSTIMLLLLPLLVSTTVSVGGSWLNSHSATNLAFVGGSSNINNNSNTPRDDKYISSNSALKAVVTNGPVLGPSACAAGDGDTDTDTDTAIDTIFDSGCVASPVVLPPSKKNNDKKWQMYYYGNPGTWANGTRCFLPTGYVGLAESDDGIHWDKIPGKEEFGSILAPTGNEDDFDGLQLGVGDVVRVNVGDENDNDNEELHMYYFGASFEAVSFGVGSPMPPAQGLRMRIGKAVSTDNGRSWERMGQVLDYDLEEGLFASWPRLIVPEEDDNNNGDNKPWRMLYHTFNGTRWAVFEATSNDRGATWARANTGKMVLGPGDSDGWDGSGVGTRAVAHTRDGELVMVYEAVGGQGGAFTGTHRMGLARWNNDDDDNGNGGVWIKDTTITGIPGGPILEPGVEPLQPWTAQVIGTPYLVANPDDGSMRLYFCSKKDSDMSMSIGLVESESGNFDPSSWKAISPDDEDR